MTTCINSSWVDCDCARPGILSGFSREDNLKDILLLDVTPLSMSIERADGTVTKLMERNSVIPTKDRKSTRLNSSHT